MVGLVSAWQVFSPAELKTPNDVLEELRRIATAIESQAMVIKPSQIPEIATALGDVTTQVAFAARGKDGTLPFVPRSFVGLSDQPLGQAYDLVAPNGKGRLMIISAPSNTWIDARADGELVGNRVRRGEHFEVEFGDQTCRVELIDIFEPDSARLRTICF
ncbi:hypothetical protein [Tropicimonas sp. IMCC34043]|uniref:hypothetical protein n=1 Tax=Tropicimonas sp. IMCC34043 TaxID=2248760 RepID=UPI0013001AEE|nr:hypothetical protein [Tropicimonas sp. IMCC34043]